MGAVVSCKHERTELVEIHDTYVQNMGWMREIVSERCLDCPQTLRVDRLKGRLTGVIYSKATVDQRDCPHEHYDVDDKSITVQRENTSVGTVLRLFMGPFMDGIQWRHFWAAEAKCKRCAYAFYVRANYEEIWRDQKRVQERSTPWKPVIHTDVKDGVTRKKYVPVPKK